MDFNNYPMEHSSEIKFTPTVVADMMVGFAVGVMFATILFDCILGTERKNYKKFKEDYDSLVKSYDVIVAEKETQEDKNEKDVDDYNKLVDRYNVLLKENEDLQKKNEKDIDDYNVLAEMYNSLLEEKDMVEKRVSRLESRVSRNLNYKE